MNQLIRRTNRANRATGCWLDQIFKQLRLEFTAGAVNLLPMSSVKEIESALTQLPLDELQSVRDWLEDFIEEQMDVCDEFKAKIERANQELAQGVHSRTRQTPAGQ
jgi:hypothetical protein